MKLKSLIAIFVVLSLSSFGLWTLIGHTVLAQSAPVQISIPTEWGKVVGVVRTNILFEASDGTIREVNLFGGQGAVVTVLKRD